MEKYTPFGHADYQTIVADIKKFAAGAPTAVVSTINGDSNVPFYKELANQGLKATDIPVVAFSSEKRSCAASIPSRCLDTWRRWNYFMSIENPVNKSFIETWKLTRRRRTFPTPTSGSPTIRWRRRTSGSRCGRRPSSRRERPT